MSVPPPIPYQALPILSPRRLRWFSIRLAVLIWPIALVLVPLLLWVVPRYGETFKDFKIQLPALTVWLLAISRFLASWWIVTALVLILVLAIPFVGPLLVSLTSSTDDSYQRRMRWVTGLVLLITTALTVAIVLGMFLPQVALMEGLTNVK